MKILIAQVLALYSFFIRLVYSLDVSNYHEIQEAERHKKPIIPILQHSFEQHHEGFKYSYETGNGIHAQETGYFKNKGDEKHETLVQQGSVTYHDEHGHPITLTYIADEHGFRPQGDHLPTPPPVPEAIQTALDNEQHEVKEEAQGEYGGYYQQSPYGRQGRLHGFVHS